MQEILFDNGNSILKFPLIIKLYEHKFELKFIHE